MGLDGCNVPDAKYVCRVEGGGLREDVASPDLHIIFPPQWSPFQPFLSTPSLKAYLVQVGFLIHQSDWNIQFYRWFIGPERVGAARRKLLHYVDNLSQDFEEYRAKAILALTTLQCHEEHYAKAMRLCDETIYNNIETVHEALQSLRRLLEAFSAAEPVIEVGTSSFSAHSILRDFETLQEFCTNADDNPFVGFFTEQVKHIHVKPRYFGISIIGNEQLIPGLTLCRVLKQHFPDVLVVIGGSVLTRLLDKEPIVLGMFGRYFDYICRYEGELPMAAFLASVDPKKDRVAGFAFVDNGQLEQTEIMEPLSMEDVPTPDFSGMPLKEYFTPELVLPLLSTRGCYWGKCGFCYHGMIYQDRYRMRRPSRIVQDVNTLNKLHGVRYFAFNDEAIPPKLFKSLPLELPLGKYFFTGLYKFEKYFTRNHFENMYKVGFRSLYIGLEAASERVQRHMRKNNTQEVMKANLRDAHEVGIWSHTFGFFGFPSETWEEACETMDFLLDNEEIIHSEGTGLFSFEHNAPVHKSPSAFGVIDVKDKPGRICELYYDYEVECGLNEDEAKTALEYFEQKKKDRSAFQGGRWIPRELLLVLLGRFGRDKLQKLLAALDRQEKQKHLTLASLNLLTLPSRSGKHRHYVVNSATGQVFETNEDALILFSMLESSTPMGVISSAFPALKALVPI